MRLQYALTAAEHVAVPTAEHAANQFAAAARRSCDLLYRLARLGQRLDPLTVFLAPQEASYWMRSAQVSSAGSITVDPKIWRIAFIDRRTASGNAVLAFSVRCHLSAT